MLINFIKRIGQLIKQDSNLPVYSELLNVKFQFGLGRESIKVIKSNLKPSKFSKLGGGGVRGCVGVNQGDQIKSEVPKIFQVGEGVRECGG